MSLLDIHHSNPGSTIGGRGLCSFALVVDHALSTRGDHSIAVVAAAEKEVEYTQGGGGRHIGNEVEYPHAGAETEQGDSSMAWEQAETAIADQLDSFLDLGKRLTSPLYYIISCLYCVAVTCFILNTLFQIWSHSGLCDLSLGEGSGGVCCIVYTLECAFI